MPEIFIIYATDNPSYDPYDSYDLVSEAVDIIAVESEDVAIQIVNIFNKINIFYYKNLKQCENFDTSWLKNNPKPVRPEIIKSFSEPVCPSYLKDLKGLDKYTNPAYQAFLTLKRSAHAERLRIKEKNASNHSEWVETVQTWELTRSQARDEFIKDNALCANELLPAEFREQLKPFLQISYNKKFNYHKLVLLKVSQGDSA